jgi:hypothetical protein
MSSSGSRAHNAVPGYSPAVAARSPGTRAAHGPSSSSRVSPMTPSTRRTPVSSGRPANSSYTESDTSAHGRASAFGSMRYGHHSAPATAEVVCSAGSRVHTRTRLPASASTTAVVRPTTPLPTTITSSLPGFSMPGR